jgi:hypothetical protein
MQPIRRILVAIKNPQGKASPALYSHGYPALQNRLTRAVTDALE